MIESDDIHHSNDDDNEDAEERFKLNADIYCNLSTNKPFQPLQNVRPHHLIKQFRCLF